MTPAGERSGSQPDPPSIIADRYKVERELGHGGMATVYLCTDRLSGNKVAVKVLKPELGGAVSVERFLREITFSSQLDHPQIPKVLGSGVLGQMPFCVMTYIEGESLRSRLDRVKQMTIDEAVRITKEIVAPMAYAHGMGIIHRDIKPANIILGKDRVYVLDFGVARAIAASADDSLTSTGVAVGTPAYMSPEQALAQDDLDERSDIFSLACVTYEMIAGMPPYVGATAQAVMARRFVAPPPPLSEVREFVPPGVEGAIAKALCKAPADRWQAISEFGDALSSATPVTPSMQTTRVVLASRKRRFGWAIAAVALVMVGITGVVAFSLTDRDAVKKARRALDAGNVAEAENRLRDEISRSGDKPDAQLWLAQAMILRNAPVDDWAPLALKASDRKAELNPADTMRAIALAAYAKPNSPNRCDGLRALSAAKDPLHPDDYTADVTLADCIASDPTIVRDSAVASGYRFAASWQKAADLYEGVISRNAQNGAMYRLLIPRLARLYPITKNALRFGVLREDGELNFAAYPILNADTIAFVPTPLTGNGAPVSVDGERLERLVKKNIDRLRDLETQWADAAPDDALAHEYLASSLEASGKIEGPGPAALASVDAARRAHHALVADTSIVTHVRLATTRVRLLIKSGKFQAARELADSVLSYPQAKDLTQESQNELDEMLAGLAALTGRPSRVIAIEQKYSDEFRVRLPSGETPKLTAELGSEAIRLSAYALVGAPRDSIINLYDRISQSLETLVPPSQLNAFRGAVLRRSSTLAIDVVGPSRIAQLGPSSDPYVRAVSALSRGDKATARMLADSLNAFRASFAPGEITPDVVFQESWLRVALGDSAFAAKYLDRALRGLSRAPVSLLQEDVAPSLVRSMMLRAALARAEGDSVTAAKWSGAASELWRNADRDVKASIRLQ